MVLSVCQVYIWVNFLLVPFCCWWWWLFLVRSTRKFRATIGVCERFCSGKKVTFMWIWCDVLPMCMYFSRRELRCVFWALLSFVRVCLYSPPPHSAPSLHRSTWFFFSSSHHSTTYQTLQARDKFASFPLVLCVLGKISDGCLSTTTSSSSSFSSLFCAGHMKIGLVYV